MWHTHLKKRLNKNSPKNNNNNSSNGHSAENILTRTISTASTIDTDQLEPITSNMSPQSSSSDLTSATEASSFAFDHEINNNNNNHNHEDEDLIIIKEEINSMEYQFQESTTYFAEIDESFWSDLNVPSEPLQIQDSFHDDLSNNIDHDMDFWFDIFIRSGGSPELPEF